MFSDDHDNFPVPGPDSGRSPSSGHRDLFEVVPGLDDLLPPALPRDPDTVETGPPDGTEEQTGPPEPGPANRAKRLLEQMRRPYDDSEDNEDTLPEAARASAEQRGPDPDTVDDEADTYDGNPFEQSGATSTHGRRARDERLSADSTGGRDRGPEEAPTGTYSPARPKAPAAGSRAAAGHAPSSSAGDDTRYVVMLDPAGQVNVDRLIEVMSGFLESDARTARRTIRRGKGLLAVGLTRSEALILESALDAERQPIITTAIEPRMIYEPPRRIELVREGDQGGILIEYRDREVEHPPDAMFLLSAGVMREEEEDGTPSANNYRAVLTMYGWTQSGCWRHEVALTGDDLQRGDRSEAVGAFREMLTELRDSARDAQRTPIFDSMCDGVLDPKHYFIDRESLENYELWQLWTRLSEGG